MCSQITTAISAAIHDRDNKTRAIAGHLLQFFEHEIKKEASFIPSGPYSPARERAKVIINNCVHASYRDELNDDFSNACKIGGQTPHLLREALSWHARFKENGTMLRTNSCVV